MSRVAMVVVRYGPQITGGAEHHARLVAQRLARRHEVTVLTTCAEDYVSWGNALPPGQSTDGDVNVRRFEVTAARDLTAFDEAYRPILAGNWTRGDEERFLRAQGPDCPALVEHLRSAMSEYDAVVLFTLLYLPTVRGLDVAAARGVLVPTLHDEPSARLSIQGDALRRAGFVLWNTPEERDLARSLYGHSDGSGAVCGVGVDAPPRPDAHGARRRHGLDRPYLLYAGRIDTEKGCGELVRYVEAWACEDPRLDLVLIGRAWMPLPDRRRIRHLGFVGDADRWGLIAGAAATVVPSRWESLSMVVLESMACATPVLARAGTPVLEGHVRRSGAGILYSGYAEFAEALRRLLGDPTLGAALGRDGRRYVAANYTWDRIDALWERAITTVAGS